MHNSFFLPNESGVRIYGYEDMTNPNVKKSWTLGEKLVFNREFKKWLKNLRESRKRLIGMSVIKEKQNGHGSMEWMIENGKYPAKVFIDNVEYQLRTGMKVADEEMELYRRLKSNGRSG